MRESLENVKVGDKVVVHRRGGDVIGTVHRVTQTMIMVGNNRFKKKNGDVVNIGFAILLYPKMARSKW